MARPWRVLAPIALFLGLFLFGVSLLVLGAGSLESNPRAIEASTLDVVGDSAVLLYPAGYYGSELARIEVTYTFPQRAGDAFFLSCDDAAALERGEEPRAPLIEMRRLPAGRFVVSDQTLGEVDPSVYRRGGQPCAASIAFRWPAPDGDPAANRPTVAATYSASRLDRENAPVLIAFMVLSAVLALGGGLAWSRQRGPSVPPPSDDSTVEALRSALDRMGAQLERTRRHLLFAGVLGIFLWYPMLVPWAWRQAAAVTESTLIPWAVAGAALAFLVVLTLLWAREFVRLDRELTVWRGRLGELRDREAGMLDALERGG